MCEVLSVSRIERDFAIVTIVRENVYDYRFKHLGSLVTAKLTLTTVRLTTAPAREAGNGE